MTDLLEKREDGVYKNGQFFISNSGIEHTSFRSARAADSWVVVGRSSGRADRDSALRNIMGCIYGAILGAIGGGIPSFLVGAITSVIPNTPPGAYSKRVVYFN